MSNLLQKWGAAKFLGDRAVKPKDFRIYRWETGKPIGRSDLNPIMESNLGSPWWTLHRHDLLTCLLKRAQELGVVIRANSRVTSVDLDAPAITLQTGERITADLFIGADGVKSVIRNTIFPGSRPYNPGGTAAAYRMSVKTADLRAVDEEMNKLFEEPAMNLWMGQNRYLIT